jgi:hypothetical protein
LAQLTIFGERAALVDWASEFSQDSAAEVDAMLEELFVELWRTSFEIEMRTFATCGTLCTWPTIS